MTHKVSSDLQKHCIKSRMWCCTETPLTVTTDYSRRSWRNAINLPTFFYSPTDAQVNCLENNFKIYIKTTPTCFGAVTPSSGSALLVLSKVTVVKIAS